MNVLISYIWFDNKVCFCIYHENHFIMLSYYLEIHLISKNSNLLECHTYKRNIEMTTLDKLIPHEKCVRKCQILIFLRSE